MRKASITPGQRRKWRIVGRALIRSGTISGFQLEDFGRTPRPALLYAHDEPRHLEAVRKGTGGGGMKARESYYKWDKAWKLGKNTRLLFGKKVATETGAYFATPKVERADAFIRRKAVRKASKRPLAGSWVVPDVRVTGRKRHARYRRAWQVTRRIDRDSRFSTLIVRKDKLRRVRRKLRGERVRKVLVQNYKGENSFYDYLLKKG